MIHRATRLFLAVLIAAVVAAAPARAQFTGGGHDESTEDFSNAVAGTAWNATAGQPATPGAVAAGVTGTHLLITEVGVRGLNSAASADSSEFVEIFNPTNCTFDLSGVYLADVNGYSALPVSGAIDLAATNTDFAMRFPAGATIAPGQVVVVAVDGGRFKRAAGRDADYMLFNAGGATTALPMVDVATNKGASYPAFGSFTNGGEFVRLFAWDGQSDLVSDLDLVYWGAPTGANAPALKTAAMCQDGPDADAATRCYLADAGNPAGTMGKALVLPASGSGTRQRTGAEAEAVTTGGNGALPPATDVALASDFNPSACGSKFTLTATVGGSLSSGSVEFRDGLTVLGGASVAAGLAVLSVTSFTAGVHMLTAAYGGDACHGAGVSPALNQVVDSAPSSVSLASDVNPSACGGKVALTASVTPADAAGTVTFYDGGAPLGSAAVVSGSATLSVTLHSADTHLLTAVYAGGGCYDGSTSPEYEQIVDPAPSTVAVTGDLNPSVCGDKVNFTATVTPAGATGTVTFFEGPDPMGTFTLNAAGTATISLSTELYAGSIPMTARYGGDACHAAGTSPEYLQVVTAATPALTLVSERNPSECGQAVSFHATITPAFVVGDLELLDGATVVATSPVSGTGTASFGLTFTGTGSHVLTVRFPGDFCTAAGASAPLEQVVNLADANLVLSSNENPVLCGSPLIVTANVQAGATGAVTFLEGTTVLATVPVDALGTARYTTSALPVGTHVLAAEYAGDACFAAARSADLAQVVDLEATETALAVDADHVVCGGKVNLTATVTGTGTTGGNGLVAKHPPAAEAVAAVTGSVTFFDGATAIGSAALDAAGVAVLSATFSAQPPTHPLTARYVGAGCFASSTSPAISERVDPLPTSVAVSSDAQPVRFGDKLNLTATVSPSVATGVVTFYDGATFLGQATLASGAATLSVTTLAVGSHDLTATYNGDDCHAPSTSPVYVQVVEADQPPVVTVLFPNGHETLIVGGDIKCYWTVTDDHQVASVSLYLSRDYGHTYETLAQDIPNTGTFVWRVTPPGTNTDAIEVYSAYFKVVATDNSGQVGEDQSDQPFSIYDLVVPAVVTRLEAAPEEGAIALRWELAVPRLFASVDVERAEAQAGPWIAPVVERGRDGSVDVAVDRTAAAGRSYWYRLVARTTAGTQVVFGPVAGTASAPREFALAAAYPNPTKGALRTEFSVPKQANVRLSLVDLQGRVVAVLAAGSYSPGRYQVDWDGRADRGGPAAAGRYFLRFESPGKTLVSRVVIAR